MNSICRCRAAQSFRARTLTPAESEKNFKGSLFGIKIKFENESVVAFSVMISFFVIMRKSSHHLAERPCSASESTGWIDISVLGVPGRLMTAAVMCDFALDVHPSSVYVYPSFRRAPSFTFFLISLSLQQLKTVALCEFLLSLLKVRSVLRLLLTYSSNYRVLWILSNKSVHVILYARWLAQ